MPPTSLNRQAREIGPMTALKWGSIVVGMILFLLGIVWVLQGANVIRGSAVMSGNSIYIYIGGIVALIGIVVVAIGYRSKQAPVKPQTAEPTQPPST